MNSIDIGGSAESLIADQIEYYEHRAADWDNYGGFDGPYPGQPDRNRSWFSDVDLMRQALACFSPRGDVLEIAAGTGMWSEQIAKTARALTVLDASSSMLVHNLNRCLPYCNKRGIAYDQICDDVFRWTPQREYDDVFFAFWICHVPPELFKPFWEKVIASLRPGGRFLFFDVRSRAGAKFEDSNQVRLREASDGSTFRVVKIRYPIEELRRRLSDFPFDVSVDALGELVLTCHGIYTGTK